MLAFLGLALLNPGFTVLLCMCSWLWVKLKTVKKEAGEQRAIIFLVSWPQRSRASVVAQRLVGSLAGLAPCSEETAVEVESLLGCFLFFFSHFSLAFRAFLRCFEGDISQRFSL